MAINAPEENTIDKLLGLTKAGIELIPGGAMGIELFSWFVTSPATKRRDLWQREVTKILNELVTRGVDVNKLVNNEEFKDILMRVCVIAIKTHQDEKRVFLKNIIVNAASDNPPIFDKQQLFLNFIDNMTVLHIRLLFLLKNPKKWFVENNQPLPGIGMTCTIRIMIESAYPELKNERDLVNSIWMDLYNKSLINNDRSVIDSSTFMPGGRLMLTETSELGQEFINFITI